MNLLSYQHPKVGSLKLHPNVLEAKFAGTIHPSQDEVKLAIAEPPRHRHCVAWLTYAEYMECLIQRNTND